LRSIIDVSNDTAKDTSDLTTELELPGACTYRFDEHQTWSHGLT
jgi:hypothetical protein